MTQAENYTKLYDGGYKDQAYRLADNMSIRSIQDWEKGETLFIFSDESAIFWSEQEFHIATQDEIEEFTE